MILDSQRGEEQTKQEACATVAQAEWAARYTPETLSQSWKVVGICSHHSLIGKNLPRCCAAAPSCYGGCTRTWQHFITSNKILSLPGCQEGAHNFCSQEAQAFPGTCSPHSSQEVLSGSAKCEKVEVGLQAVFIMRLKRQCLVSQPVHCWCASTGTLQNPL